MTLLTYPILCVKILMYKVKILLYKNLIHKDD